jgi:hypothetical protein
MLATHWVRVTRKVLDGRNLWFQTILCGVEARDDDVARIWLETLLKASATVRQTMLRDNILINSK